MIEDRPEAKDEHGNPLPPFITGHSLGGALALLATKLAASDVTGACYTFGAPGIGSYEFFRLIKTPVCRVVNSSDVVPRVPPGAAMLLLTHAAKGASWLTGFVPPVSSLFDKLEELLDELNGYRHYGDMRSLTDAAEGRFDTVRVSRFGHLPYWPDTTPLSRCPWRPRNCPGTPRSRFGAMCRPPTSQYS